MWGCSLCLAFLLSILELERPNAELPRWVSLFHAEDVIHVGFEWRIGWLGSLGRNSVGESTNQFPCPPSLANHHEPWPPPLWPPCATLLLLCRWFVENVEKILFSCYPLHTNKKKKEKEMKNFTIHYHLFASWIHQQILNVGSHSACCTFDSEVHARYRLISWPALHDSPLNYIITLKCLIVLWPSD